MTKRIKLTEKQIEKAINEISYGTVDDANSINHNLFWGAQNGTSDNGYYDGFDNFYNKLEELEYAFNDFTPNLKNNSANSNIIKINSLVNKISNYLTAIRTCSDEINNIFIRKEKQRDNFDNAIRDYDNAHGNDDISWDEYKKGEINK
jgi:hypothetical protein